MFLKIKKPNKASTKVAFLVPNLIMIGLSIGLSKKNLSVSLTFFVIYTKGSMNLKFIVQTLVLLMPKHYLAIILHIFVSWLDLYDPVVFESYISVYHLLPE